MNATIDTNDLHIEVAAEDMGADAMPAYDGPLAGIAQAFEDGDYPATAYPNVGSPMAGTVSVRDGAAEFRTA